MLNLLLEILLVFFLHELQPNTPFHLDDDRQPNHYYIYLGTIKDTQGKKYAVAQHAWVKENGRDTIEPPVILRTITPESRVRYGKPNPHRTPKSE